MWGEIHEELDAALEDARILDDIVTLSGYILYSLNHLSERFSGSTRYREAICIFTASHMRGAAMSYGDVAQLYGVSERDLRKGYDYVFSRRYELIDCGSTEFMGIDRVLGTLPALNWPVPTRARY